MAVDALPKLANELPNTDEPERVGAALVVTSLPHRLTGFGPGVAATRTHLQPVWFVDFFRGRPEAR